MSLSCVSEQMHLGKPPSAACRLCAPAHRAPVNLTAGAAASSPAWPGEGCVPLEKFQLTAGQPGLSPCSLSHLLGHGCCGGHCCCLRSACTWAGPCTPRSPWGHCIVHFCLVTHQPSHCLTLLGLHFKSVASLRIGSPLRICLLGCFGVQEVMPQHGLGW